MSTARSRSTKRRSHRMIALEARDLVVEVGGKIVVDGLSFDLRAGDKIGVVGRNGAGKTSTMKVLAGEDEPAGGTVVRRGRSAISARTRGSTAPRTTTSRLEHILGRARPRGPQPPRSRRPGSRLDEAHDERAIRRFSRLEEEYTLTRRLSGRGGREDDRRGARAGGGPARAAGRRCCPAASADGSSLRGSSSAARDLLLLDEPTNHLDVDAKHWLMKFLARLQGRADGDQPRHRAARRVDHADPAPRRGRGRRVQGHVHRSTALARRRDEERLTKLAARQDRRDQTAEDARRLRCAGRRSSARGWRSRSTPASPGSSRRRSRGRRARSACASGSPSRPTAGRTVAGRRGPGEVLRRTARVHRRLVLRSGGGSGCWSSD